ncbi:MAG TPA: carboxypeptidase regulatory-like domain-containing protein, partial [Thermoplasmata archaeon]
MFASPRSSARPSKFIVSALSALLAWILLMQIGVPVTASGPNGWVKGYVTDASTGMPLPGAFVRVEPNALPWAYELTTDAGGYFEVSAVPQKYNVIILESFHQPFQVEVGVGSLQTTWVNASLAAASPRTAALKGYVTDSATSGPVTVGRVVAVPLSPPFEYINLSYLDASTGYYEIGLVPGDYSLFTDSIPGYFGFGASVSLADGEVSWLNISLDPNPSDSSITGTVYDLSTLTPIVGATVSVDVDDLFLPNVTTNATGGYTIPVAAGIATVTGNALGYGPDTEIVFVSPMTSYSLDLYLRPILGFIQGYVSDIDTGLPLPNATVSASDFDAFYDHSVTDGTGYYEIPVPEGFFDLEGSASGYFPYFAGFLVSEGELLWWNFSMVPIPPIVATVQGYVVDASNGANVPDMTVAVVDFFSGFSNSTSADGTGFYALGVVESPLLLVLVPAAGGYAGGQTFASVSPGDVVWVNVTIYPLNATVRAYVTDALTGLPISGAFVSLSWGFTYSALNITDSNGDADVLSPATMDVSLFVSAGGYYGDSRTITVAPGLNLLDIELYPVLPFDVSVRGYITDNGTGNPIAGAQVEASGYPSSTVWNFTDPSGYYELWIVAQPQLVRATYPGYASNETTVSPSPGDTVWVNLTLDFDPVPPEFVSFTATPDVGVSPGNPTSLVADILEKKLDSANTTMTLLRMMNATGPNGTFLAVGPVDPADLFIAQPASGEYTVSATWDAQTPGGWIQ